MKFCYSTKAKFFRDSDELTNVEWYWTDPDAPFLTFQTPFRSSVWLPKSDWTGLGEQSSYRKVLRDGTDGPDYPATCYLGTLDQWRNGLQLSDLANIPPIPDCCIATIAPESHLIATCTLSGQLGRTVHLHSSISDVVRLNGTLGDLRTIHSSLSCSSTLLAAITKQKTIQSSLHAQTTLTATVHETEIGQVTIHCQTTFNTTATITHKLIASLHVQTTLTTTAKGTHKVIATLHAQTTCNATATDTPGSSFDIGFDFRSTAGYVTDPTNCHSVLSTTLYPTAGGGTHYGWVANVGQSDRDRDNTLDPRLAGLNFISNSGTQAVFLVDLPATGNYKITLAAGDASFLQPNENVMIAGGTGTPIVIAGASVSAGHFIDATGVDRTSASDWVTNNASKTLLYTSTQLAMYLGTTSSQSVISVIAHLRITKV